MSPGALLNLWRSISPKEPSQFPRFFHGFAETSKPIKVKDRKTGAGPGIRVKEGGVPWISSGASMGSHGFLEHAMDSHGASMGSHGFPVGIHGMFHGSRGIA